MPLALILLGSAGAVAVADPSSPLVQAIVYEPGGSTVNAQVATADLEAKPSSCPPYTGPAMAEHGRNGTNSTVQFPPTTWGVAAVISCLTPQVTLADVTGVTVIQSNGLPETATNSEQLTPPDWTPPYDFSNPAETPVFFDRGTANEYDRPSRQAGDDDLDDEVVEPTPIEIEVFEGPLLTVTAAASQTTVPAGASVSFTADVTSGGDGSAGQYSWSFDGGAADSTQQDPTVTFATAGTWDVSVLVTDQSGGGGSAEIPVTVTSPTAPPSSNTGTAPSGPQTSTGTTPGAPTGTQTTPGSTPTGRPKTEKQTGQSTTRHPSGHRSTQTGHRTARTQTQTQSTSTSARPGGSSGSSGSSTGSGGGASPSPASATTPPRTTTTPSQPPTHRPPPLVRASTGTLVTGRLISDIVPLTASVSPLVHDVPSPTGSAPAVRPRRSTSALPIIAGILAVTVLLSLGAVRELGWPRRWPVPHVSA